MRCSKAREFLTRRQSEPLDDDIETRLNEHLAACRACAQEERLISGTAALMAGAGSEPAVQPILCGRPSTAALLSRTQSGLARENGSLRALAFGAAALVVALAALGIASRHSFDPTTANGAIASKRSTNQITTGHTPNTSGQKVAVNQAGSPNGKASGTSAHGDTHDRGIHSALHATNSSTGGQDTKVAAARKPAADDLAYLNPDQNASKNRLSPWPSDQIAKLEATLRKSAREGDSFVTVPAPSVAGADAKANEAAIRAYQKEREIVDARLVRKVTLACKAVAFDDLCRQLMQATGITLSVNRRVADDQITIYCRERPLRDVMRAISGHFNFTWLRSGQEGAYEYELSQSLKSELLEEALREKDRTEILLALDRQMEAFRPYLGMSQSQIKALAERRLAEGIKEKSAFEQFNRLNMLQRGGLVAANMFFRLSAHELDQLRNGETLTWDLANGDTHLPAAMLNGIESTFKESVTGVGRDPGRITADLKLDMSKPGEYVLKGGLYGSDGGMSATLASAKSPSKDRKRIDNTAENAALANDPTLQQKVSLQLKPTCTVSRPPYPDYTLAYAEIVGPRLLTADVLEAIHEKTGRDIIGDQFMRLHDPAAASSENAKLFDVLNRAGDAMQIRWMKDEGWLKFRSPDYYYSRPQEVPSRLMAHWAEEHKKHGALGLQELIEISQLTEAQLDSDTMAQGAVGYYGLEEWQIAREKQGRPHFRLLARLSRQQLGEAESEKGLAFSSLSPQLKREYIRLSESSQAGVWPSEVDMRSARLRVIYTPEAAPHSAESLAHRLLVRNAAVFLYSYGQPARFSMIGPFNAIIGLSEPMMAARLAPPKPGKPTEE